MYVEKDAEMKEKRLSLLNVILMLSKFFFSVSRYLLFTCTKLSVFNLQ